MNWISETERCSFGSEVPGDRSKEGARLVSLPGATDLALLDSWRQEPDSRLCPALTGARGGKHVDEFKKHIENGKNRTSLQLPLTMIT